MKNISIALFVLPLIIFICNCNVSTGNCNNSVSSQAFYKSEIDSFRVSSVNYCQRGFVCISSKEDSCIKFAAVYDENLGTDFYSLAEKGDIVLKAKDTFELTLIKDKETKYNIFVGWK